MFNFLKIKPVSFAIDISDRSFRVVRLKKKGKFFTLSSWGKTIVEPGVVEKGEIKDREKFIAYIKEAVSNTKGKKIRTKNVVVSLPEREAFLQIIKMPKMKEKELAAAVPFEAENYIPFNLSEVYLDFQIVPPLKGYSNEYYDVLIVAIPRRIVDSYVECLKEAKLNPVAMEVESQSIARSLVKDNVSGHPILIIDCGRSRTNLLIFSGHSLLFTSSVAICSEDFTKALSNELKLPFKEAEKVKIRYGFPVLRKKNSDEEKIFKAIGPVMNGLVSEIEKYIEYFETHTSDKVNYKIEKIVLSGRGANLKNLPEYISAKTKLPVEFGNPWVNILPSPLKEVPALSFRNSLGYTTAFGLAIRAIEEDKLL